MKLFVKGGFTIIELLVSITVIAILSSLLLVTLSQSRRKVHAVVCLSNLRQINLGWQIAIDTDDNGFGWRWPGALYTHSEFLGSAQGKWWASEWGNTNRSSICPAAPQRLEKDRPAAGLNALGHYTGAYNTAWTADVRTLGYAWMFNKAEPNYLRAGSYSPNGWLSLGYLASYDEPHWLNQPEPFRTEADVVHPSRTPTFADGAFRWRSGSSSRKGPRADDLPPRNLRIGITGLITGMDAFCLPRHGSSPSVPSTNHSATLPLPGAINVVFSDGHAEQVKLDRLWSLAWHRDYRPPSKRPGLQ